MEDIDPNGPGLPIARLGRGISLRRGPFDSVFVSILTFSSITGTYGLQQSLGTVLASFDLLKSVFTLVLTKLFQNQNFSASPDHSPFHQF